MPELLAVGPKPDDRWKRAIPTDGSICLGRAPRNGWKVPWDQRISREHAELSLQDGTLHVQRLGTARNPIYVDGNDTSEFQLKVGEQFQIGETKFQLIDVAPSDDAAQPIQVHTYGTDELKQTHFGNADARLEVLAGLPHAMANADSDEDFASKLVEMILKAVNAADAAAVVQYDLESDSLDPSKMRWDSRTDDVGRFRPSRRLMKAVLAQKETMLHSWANQDGAEGQNFTLQGNLDWAYCTPVTDESCPGWCLYVSGKYGEHARKPADLTGDVRFTELLAQFIGASRRVRMLERQRARMSEFFAPQVVETMDSEFIGITDSGMNARASNGSLSLEPREGDITIFFCDLRGFSRQTEQDADNLKVLLMRVSEALGVMTRGIMKYDGIVADFLGDAALGFWGWPQEVETGPLLACQAALAVQKEFLAAAQVKDGPLANFKIGIGIAHGRAIAGKIGTSEQAKMDVFGPVVNLGSRLEGMTKDLQVPILIDHTTSEYVRKYLPASEGRCRRIGKFRPVGMDIPVMVSELLQPAGPDSSVSDEQVTDMDHAVDAFLRGEWDEALECLGRLPTKDRAKDKLMIYIAQNGYAPPPNWDGVIELKQK